MAGSGKSKVLWLIPVGCLGLVAVCAGLVALVFGIVSTSIRGSEPYQVAIARAKAHPDVIAALGTPIEEGRFPMGSIEVSGQSGRADLTLPIHGPRGKAKVFVQAEKFAGTWEYRRMVVQLDGRQIDLMAGDVDPGVIDL